MEERFFLRFPPRLIQCCRFPLERNSLERKFETADRPQPVSRSGPDPRVTPLETSDRRSPFRPASGVDEHVPRRLRGRVDPTVDLQVCDLDGEPDSYHLHALRNENSSGPRRCFYLSYGYEIQGRPLRRDPKPENTSRFRLSTAVETRP